MRECCRCCDGGTKAACVRRSRVVNLNPVRKKPRVWTISAGGDSCLCYQPVTRVDLCVPEPTLLLDILSLKIYALFFFFNWPGKIFQIWHFSMFACSFCRRKRKKSHFRRLENVWGRKKNIIINLFPLKLWQRQFELHSFLGKAASLLGRIWSQCVGEYFKTWQWQSLEVWKPNYSLRPLGSICC